MRLQFYEEPEKIDVIQSGKMPSTLVDLRRRKTKILKIPGSEKFVPEPRYEQLDTITDLMNRRGDMPQISTAIIKRNIV